MPTSENLPDPDLDENSVEVLERRYLKTDKDGNPSEEPKDLFWRVATTIAKEEEKYEDSPYSGNVDKLARIFYNLMANGVFEPNSPTLFNAGKELGQLSACFVLPIEDSMTTKDNRGIMDTLRDAALIHKSGGGTGFSFSKLRPNGSRVGSTGGVASGPVSFMKIYDAMTEQVKQGGYRRGANMGILRCDHPDVVDFVNCKTDQGEVENFNISVAATDEFMEAALQDKDIELDHPEWEDGPVEIRASELFDQIVENAWKNGEPGLFFIDEANRENPVPNYDQYEATNPCGEQALFPYDVCNLGSINLGDFVEEVDYEGENDPVENVEWSRLARTIELAVRFLDNVIDANNFPLDEIREVSDKIRRIGLGPMGLADMLIRLGLPYDSDEAREFVDILARFFKNQSRLASYDLAQERGTFSLWEESVWGPDDSCARNGVGERIKPLIPLRNANITTVAPTGTISIIAECSGGIEPLFEIGFIRNQAGTKMVEVNDDFLRAVQDQQLSGIYEDRIARFGKQSIPNLPEKLNDVFVTAGEISPYDHIDMQAVWQKHIDNGISKTINFSADATVQDVREGYIRAYRKGCKGITVYRDGTRDGQVLETGDSGTELASNNCPQCEEPLVEREGCMECTNCFFSKCGV